MRLPVLLLILSTVTMSACAQLALKLGMSGDVARAPRGSAIEFVLAVAGSPSIWIGLSIYAASMVLWLWVLARTDLSLAYPFVGISFVIIMFFGAVVLHESVSPARIAGTLLIAAGCLLVARSA
jgi:drug/metabolite transporter (DMT)-like permease